MKFNQPCFIRKNTPELREYLKKLGHKEVHSISKNKSHKKYLYTYNGRFSQENGHFISCLKDYNCGTNEDLFKAIAAISDELLEGQYIKADADFTVYWGDQAGNDLSCHIKKDEVFTADRVFLHSECFDRDAWHMMSVQELIEYFKNK